MKLNPLKFIIVTAIVITTGSGPGLAQTDLPLHLLKLPSGFKVNIFARVPRARSLTVSPEGTVFVGTRTGDTVHALVDSDKDGTADEVIPVVKNMEGPNGVFFHNGSLYIAQVSRIWRFDNIEATLRKPNPPVLVTSTLPSDQWHGWKFIGIGPDEKLYVPVGAPCNVCEREDVRYASILRMNLDGSGAEVFAKGVRNTVGFDWHPRTGELWFTDNGRDMLGDGFPPDELNHAPRAGMHFGFPYCHGNGIPDPEYGKHDCDKFAPPAMALGPHVASLGMRFYTGTMFPEEYRDQIFIAEHGSWNRSSKIGYRVMLVRLKNNEAVSYEPFAEGWLQGESRWGRPVDVDTLPDGSLLISDDFAGIVYRVSYDPA